MTLSSITPLYDAHTSAHQGMLASSTMQAGKTIACFNVPPLGTENVFDLLDFCIQSNMPYAFFAQPDQGIYKINIGTTSQAIMYSGFNRFEHSKAFLTQIFNNIDTANGAVPVCHLAYTFENHSSDSDFSPAQVTLPTWSFKQTPDGNEWTHALETGSQNAWEANWLKFEYMLEHKQSPIKGIASEHELAQETNKEVYTNWVKEAIAKIKGQELKKIALSRTKDYIKAQKTPWSTTKTLQSLSRAYPSCTICALSSVDGRTHFISATPEKLFQIRNNKLQTEAIAGTIKKETDHKADTQNKELLASCPKTLKEHNYVRDYLACELKRLGIRPEVSPTRILSLNHLHHLKTSISATLSNEEHPIDIIQRLHPTPAIGGLPKIESVNTIASLESHSREMYAGAIGWIDKELNSDIFVAIRCAKIQGSLARLYAGAGIVEASDPEAEYEETELKFRTLSEHLK